MEEGEKMRDIEKKILEKYCVEVEVLRKVRGGFLCETEQGVLFLKELSSSDKKMPYVQFLCEQLSEQGNICADEIFPNKEGVYVSEIPGERQKFILKRWVGSRECDIKREREVLEATKVLAQLHNEMDIVSKQVVLMQESLAYDVRWDDFSGRHFLEELNRRNRELNKVRRFVRKKVSKGEFEVVYLKEFQKIYDIAAKVVELLKEECYEELYRSALQNKSIAHGDYNHHNIIYRDGRAVITNFERFQINIPGSDLYYFMRKILEKKNWNEELGEKMLRVYQGIRPLSETEKSYIGLRLLYPEKFWKITNYYYNSNKAWISEKSVEKLNAVILQMEQKKRFLREIFSLQNL